MDFFRAVSERTSVRNFQPTIISDEEWTTILRAAMAAPSAVNCQPWEFVLIQNRQTLVRLAEKLPYAKMTSEAAGAILVCAIPERAFEGSKEFAVIDAALASQNLLLAVTALGYGAVWTAVYSEAPREKDVRTILGLPANVIPLCLIPIGKPAGEVPAKDKFKPELIHREHW